MASVTSFRDFSEKAVLTMRFWREARKVPLILAGGQQCMTLLGAWISTESVVWPEGAELTLQRALPNDTQACMAAALWILSIG